MVPDSAVLYIALVGMVVVAILFTLELRRWRDVSHVITRRQRILRVFLIVLIELLFVLILAGPRILLRADGERGVLIQLCYWSLCLIIGLVVVVLAFVDLRAVIKGYAAVNRGLLGDLRDEDRREDE